MSRDDGRLTERLWAEGWRPSPWSNAPDDAYRAHEHPYDKVLVVTAGSITFGLPETESSIAMHAGDRLDLPAGTSHDALVGPGGVTCLEAHAPAGTLHGVLHRAAGAW